ncbi:MAG: hypothetical protein JRG73_00355 [Deltaproteobacteria bacterium]|nr:hypothetical protein [Deltaproteobacteria bacterium]
MLLADNTRFLILPHSNIPDLASRILAVNLKRLFRDRQVLHGHPIRLVENFVDPRFFQKPSNPCLTIIRNKEITPMIIILARGIPCVFLSPFFPTHLKYLDMARELR